MKSILIKALLFSVCLFYISSLSFAPAPAFAEQMPFYNLNPKDIVLRSSFSTYYSSSSLERKHNIYLASKSIDNYLVDVGAEFSFNRAVGKRTIERGYQNAKIIFNGDFIDGVGGGVCQVSTTLYNAVLLSGLKVSEYHPHSLAVSYVPPSFDAMVNSNTADFRFINNTSNPIIIRATATGSKLTIQILGEKLDCEITRKSVTIGSILPPENQEIFDEKGEFPDLYEGQSKFIRYPKEGLKSQGYLVYRKNGKVIKTQKIRTDKYNPIQGIIVHGSAKKPVEQAPNLSITM